MQSTATDILQKHKLRRTNCRVEVLNVLHENAGQGLSQPYIEDALNGAFDRATIYRTLNTFVDNGVVHRIPDEDSGLRFALCADECQDGDHQHHHVHFKCVACGTTQCLDELSLHMPQLPKGFTVNEMHYLISGECPDCTNNKQ